MFPLLEDEDAIARLKQLAKQNLPRIALSEIELLAPV
jgi:hypothetical protein